MFARMWQVGWLGMSGLALVGSLALAGCSHSRGGCGGAPGAAGGAALASSAPAAYVPVTAPAAPAAAPTVDSRPYGGQKTCPVMDEPLGSMGPAISIAVKGETIYVCCKGCAAKVQRDPDKYLPKVAAERAGQ